MQAILDPRTLFPSDWASGRPSLPPSTCMKVRSPGNEDTCKQQSSDKIAVLRTIIFFVVAFISKKPNEIVISSTNCFCSALISEIHYVRRGWLHMLRH